MTVRLLIKLPLRKERLASGLRDQLESAGRAWLDEQCKQHKLEVRAPHFSVCGFEDAAVLEWWVDPRKLTIYLSFGAAQYIKIWGPKIECEMEDGHVGDGFPVLWAWLNGEQNA